MWHLFILTLSLCWQIVRLNACDSVMRLKAEKGILMSEENFANYQTPTRCVWEIQVSAGSRIELDIRVFDMETSCCSCTEDFVEFRDGLNTSSPLIGRYCAKNQPESIYSSGNVLRVQYFSSVKKRKVNKFKAEYRAICGGFTRGRLGEIHSPKYPSFSRGRCLFTIAVPFGWVKVTFTNFTVGDRREPVFLDQCGKDFVAVKEISLVQFNNTSQDLILCGRLKSPEFFSTSGRELSLLYESTSRNRFAAKFEAVTTGFAQCGGVVTNDAGYIFSYGYPQQFPIDTTCTWKIEVLQGFIELKFLIFNFSELQDGCPNGKVDVFDGWATSSLKIRTNCGLLRTQFRIVSRTNRLLVKARSGKTSRTGFFLLSYRAIEQGLCGHHEFSCINRKCVNRHKVCDGIDNCLDGSDEMNCPRRKEGKALYALWLLVVLIATLLMGFWLWRTWKKAVRHTLVRQRHQHPPSTRTEDYEYEVPSQSGAPPSYNEALRQGRGSLPTYEEAVGDDVEDTRAVLLEDSNSVRFINGQNSSVCHSSHLSGHSHGRPSAQIHLTTNPTSV